jgi:hypothetical protein
MMKTHRDSKTEKRNAKAGDEGAKRNWFQKKKDNLIGTKEERARDKEANRKRREEENRRVQVGSG